MRVWSTTAAHPSNGISRARITDRLTRENWRDKATVRRGATSIYYTYLNYYVEPETGPWHVTVHGNDVNDEVYPRTHEFSREFADLDEALRYANGEDDSWFAESTILAETWYWPRDRPGESYIVIQPGLPRPRSQGPPEDQGRRTERRMTRMKPTVKGKRITLACRYSGAPGFEWLSRMEFTTRHRKIIVREWIGDETWQDHATLSGTLAWRKVAHFLAEIEADHCVPGEALGHVVITGVNGWRADVLALCWCRFGEDKKLNSSSYLVDLTDRHLEALWREYGPIARSTPGLPPLLEEIEKLRNLVSAEDFRRRLELWPGRRTAMLERGFLGRLIADLEREAEDDDEITERVGQQPGVIELVSRVTATWSKPTGYIGHGLYSARVRELRDWVVEFLLTHGKLPDGRHKVADLGRIDFGPALCGIFKQ
jgi:hypothetical protein